MHSYHLLHSLLHHRKHSPSTLASLYVSYVVRTAIFSYLAIFLPIYYFMLAQKLELNMTQAWIVTLLFFTLLFFIKALGAYLAPKIAHRYSHKVALILSVAFLTVAVLMLSISNQWLIIFFASIALGLQGGIWWVLYHLDFCLAGKKTEYGKEIGFRQALGILSGVITPFLAGYTIAQYGYSALYFFTAFLALILALVLYLLQNQYKIPKIRNHDLINEIKKNKRDFMAFIGIGGELSVSEVVWPILLYLVFQKPLIIGSITALIALAAFLTSLVTGFMSDKWHKDKLEHYGVAIVSLSWLGKYLTQTTLGIVVFDIVYRIFNSLFYVPIVTFSYLRLLTENRTAYITARQMAYSLGRVIFLLIGVFLLLLGFSYWSLLILGAISPLLTFALQKTKAR